jgi:hypothetical protein
MNCKSCNTEIDYRFLTKCDHCNGEIEPTGNPIIATVEPERRFILVRSVINLAYVLVSSIAGMISGAVVVYFGGALVYLASFSHTTTGDGSHDCARGTAIAMMLILSGGFLGTMAGSAFAIKNPVCKRNI